MIQKFHFLVSTLKKRFHFCILPCQKEKLYHLHLEIFKLIISEMGKNCYNCIDVPLKKKKSISN